VTNGKLILRHHRFGRITAVETLSKLKDFHAVKPVIKVLVHGSGNVRRAAAKSLAKLDEPKWQGIIRGDDGDFQRLNASGDSHAVELLIKALEDRDTTNLDVRKTAAKALLNLYKTSTIESNRNKILSLRNVIIEHHTDYWWTVYYDSYEENEHHDSGIGIEFPL